MPRRYFNNPFFVITARIRSLESVVQFANSQLKNLLLRSRSIVRPSCVRNELTAMLGHGVFMSLASSHEMHLSKSSRSVTRSATDLIALRHRWDCCPRFMFWSLQMCCWTRTQCETLARHAGRCRPTQPHGSTPGSSPRRRNQIATPLRQPGVGSDSRRSRSPTRHGTST